jgi:hypothetical protein
MRNHLLMMPHAAKPLRLNYPAIFLVIFISLTALMINSFFQQHQPRELQLMSPTEEKENELTAVSPAGYDIVFVSRKILREGSNDNESYGDMPGAGPYSRFLDCAPGKLLIYKANGTLVTLVDGTNPTAASLNLIDVNAPDVSYDGTQIVFAGLPAPAAGQVYDTLPKGVQGAWHIYKMNVNGTGLTQLTNDSLVINNTQFNAPGKKGNNFSQYDDIDPIWMADGRICFSSSRWPSTADYGGARTTNLYVMNNDGSSMHRITSERNGAERPMMDPLTGQIVFARWWRNGRVPLDDTSTLADPATPGGYIRKGGLSSNPAVQSVAPYFITFNGWVAAAINPDGRGLHLFAGGTGNNEQFNMYGGSFTSTNTLVANYFPENRLSGEGGFGGVETHVRGAGNYLPLAGYNYDGPTDAPAGTADSLERFYSVDGYASDACVLPNDNVVISWAPDTNQDYGLYVVDSAGANKTLIYNVAGTAEMRAKAIVVRTVPPVIADQVTTVASLYPPLAAGPYNIDGNFTFDDLNVYANGPVDMDITSAPAVGSAGSIKFFINQQRTRVGSNTELDWPIQLAEMPISAAGAVINPNSPADVPLFEQLRTSSLQGYTVPVTGDPVPSSTAHVAGMNYGRPTQTMTCMGCHRGHSMIPVPADTSNVQFTNLAPGATVTLSSAQTAGAANAINDRQVQLAFPTENYWYTARNITQNQWAKLNFPVSIKINDVRIYNIPAGGLAASTLQVTEVQVNLYSDSAATQPVATQTISQNLASTGTDVLFTGVVAKVVQINILGTTGVFGGKPRTGLAEVEVIASANTQVTPMFVNKKPKDNLEKLVLAASRKKRIAFGD